MQFFKMVGGAVGTVGGAIIAPLDGGETMRGAAALTADSAANWADNVKGNVEAVGGLAIGNGGGDEGKDDMRDMDWFQRLCAQLCNDIYNIQWSAITGETDTSTVPRGYEGFERIYSNFPYYATYQKGDDVIVVFRGTDTSGPMTVATDVTADANLVLHGLVAIGDSVRGVQCLNEVDRHLKAGKKVWVTGHSLGGAVAWYVCYSRPTVNGHAFNPPAGPRPTALKNLTVHINGWDPVSWKWPYHGVADKHYNSKTSANGEYGHSMNCFYGLRENK